MKSRFGIVVIGYNRVDSISRLLDSLKNADYMNERVDLIISIDNSGYKDVENFAEGFQWNIGQKIIKTYPERQGLRKHVLACGGFVKEYDAIAVFEDDIVASPSFYHYMKQAVDFYSDDNRIAGISLYSHLLNVNAKKNFIPEPSDSDIYFMQFAQSWGQIWMRKQWLSFEEWYKENSGVILESDELPNYITDWPDSSWLKYHIKYCVENNKYFVYPYVSQSTCFFDVGQHSTKKETALQVPMSTTLKKDFRFVPFDHATVIYDVFFERQNIESWFNIPKGTTCIDLYGIKKISKNTKYSYILTTQVLDYKILKTYGLDVKPHECNVYFDIEGDIIRLYDLTSTKNNEKLKEYEVERLLYHQKIVNSNKDLLMILRKRFKDRITRNFKKILRKIT